LLVYDCTDEQSFKDIEVWMNNIKQHASENVEKILIANKTDMFHVRKISPERGADLALEHNMPFAEVSAKASVGVNDAFDMLVRNIIRNRGDLLEQAAQAGTAPIKVTSKAKFPIGPNPCACN
jgi:Ras-related protein Rab-8A